MALCGIHFYCVALRGLVGTISTNLLFLGLGFKLVCFFSSSPPPASPPACSLFSPAGKGFQALEKKTPGHILLVLISSHAALETSAPQSLEKAARCGHG